MSEIRQDNYRKKTIRVLTAGGLAPFAIMPAGMSLATDGWSGGIWRPGI